MLQTTIDQLIADVERKSQWDRFLDKYSAYLNDPSLANAAHLKLAAADLEVTDESFSLEEFTGRLGFPEEVALAV